MKKRLFFLLLLPMITRAGGCLPNSYVSLIYDLDVAAEVFAAKLISNALLSQDLQLYEGKADDAIFTIVFKRNNMSLQPEAYNVTNDGRRLVIEGGDAIGIMYAATDVADQLRLGTSIIDVASFAGAPYLKKRGIKFNIPLDARTPSYDDRGDAAQNAIPTVWEFAFWENFIENMARYRYNVLSLWIPHPFPSMVFVPEYPDVALPDVCVYTGEIRPDTRREWDHPDDDIQNPAKLTTVRQMTIDEKVRFWQKVFSYAENLGIEIHLYTWNVFVYGAEGKHGITWKQDNPVTIDYVRKSVRQFLLTYPQVKAIGLTAGEHIDKNIDAEYNIENWLYLTYGKGIMDAKALNPSLDVAIIFRQHHTKMEHIRKAFDGYKGIFETEFKYSRARMFSSTRPPFFDRIYRQDVEANNMKCWMNVRNDDCYVLRWGDPLYAMEYIRNLPYAITAGFIMGGDGYVYGKDFASKNPAMNSRYEIEKQWYLFMSWGRAAYDPWSGEKLFIDQLGLRWPAIDANMLFRTWRNTSAINSWVNKLFFGPNDHEFCFEGCFRGHPETRAQKFIDIDAVIAKDAMPHQGVIPIASYAHAPNLVGISPFDVADSIESAANAIILGANALNHAGDTTLIETLDDLRAWAQLGMYYAAKFRGATWTALFRTTGNEVYRQQAIASLEKALSAWRDYAKTAGKLYNPQTLARQGRLDYHASIEAVENDIDIAKNAQQGQPVGVVGNNRLWEIKSLYY